jgi:excinuclease ABC subunit C
MFNLETIPKDPGCYLFKNKKNNVIYVGKAKNLKKRVGSYFQKKDLDTKTQAMLRHVKNLDFIITDTEVEALVLENTLIKKYQPHYNVRLKDAKSHSYICISDEKFPRIFIDRRKKTKGDYFGPFVSAQERDYILRFIKKTFALRTCKRLPKRACLRFHIGLCDAPCIQNITKEEYKEKVDNVKMVLSGHVSDSIKKLKSDMKKFSEGKKYEKALRVREQIKALEYLSERQKMQREKKYDEDIINFVMKEDVVYLMVFNVYKGTLTNKNEFVFENNHDEGFFDDFLIQFYSENPVPKELIIPRVVDDSLILFLNKIRGDKVHVKVPKRGEKKQLLELVEKNIERVFFKDSRKVKALKNSLNLNEYPNVIECFDISHLSGTSTVGSMVQFRNGRADKQNYRRFKIRSVEGVDDFAAISEVVRRRYSRVKNEDIDPPDLIVIDGGRGQLNAAWNELKKLGFQVPLISIAKEFEEIYMPGEKKVLRLDEKDKGLHYLQEIRDEAHRFAIKYNRLLRSKKLVER